MIEWKLKQFIFHIALLLSIGLLSNSLYAENTSRLKLTPLSDSAWLALSNQQTWIPALGSMLVAISGEDHAISDWASATNPVFGSSFNARNASDQLNALGSLNLLVSSLLVPVPEQETVWRYRGKQFIFSSMALESTYLTTKLIKTQSNKLRPDESDRLSFPSGHTSRAAVQSTMSVANIAELHNIHEIPQHIWQTTTLTVAALTGWARIEGKKHYPSDVLAGYALGNFFGQLANNMLLHPDRLLSISYVPEYSFGIQLSYRW